MIGPMILAVAGVVGVGLGGYLFGVRRGSAARSNLRDEARQLRERLAVAEARTSEPDLDRLRDDLIGQIRPLVARQNPPPVRDEIAAVLTPLTERVEALSAEVHQTRRGDDRRQTELAQRLERLSAAQDRATARLENELAQLLKTSAQGPDLKRIRELVEAAIRPLRADMRAPRHEVKAAVDAALKPLLADLKNPSDEVQAAVHAALEPVLEDLRAPRDASMKAAVQEAIEPLLAQRAPQMDDLKAAVHAVIDPIFGDAPIRKAMAGIETSGHRADLASLLSEIAARAGLSTVLVCDAGGLALAASSEAESVELRAGMAALSFIFAEHHARSELPAVLAVNVHDVAGRSVLNRVFEVDDNRFAMVAVAEDQALPADLFDMALPKIRRMMGDWTQINETRAAHA
jgi:hypothetical protein